MANPGSRGQQKDKPFRDALRMEIAAAGEDMKALRRIAKNLLELAEGKDTTALNAIKEIADRMDGKAVQQVEVGEPGAFDHLDDSELTALIAEQANRLKVPLSKRRGNGTSH